MLALVFLCAAAPLGAQSAGKTGAQVLQLQPGGRAAALAGAYTAAADADALFYNPAGIATARHGASMAYETFALDVGFGSVAGFTRLGRLSVGASVMYLDAGSITEIIPDPEFGGNAGTPTDASWRASETAARLSLALPVRPRLQIGASLGFVSTGIADASQNAPIADFGAHYDAGRIQLGASLRNIGGTMSGGGDEPLPTELRVGMSAPIIHVARRFYADAFVDGIAHVREGSFGAVAALEAGIPRATSQNDIGAAVRIGYDLEPNQLGALHFGAGVSLRGVSVDYAYQNLDMIGAVHRFGVRWTVWPVAL